MSILITMAVYFARLFTIPWADSQSYIPELESLITVHNIDLVLVCTEPEMLRISNLASPKN